MRATGDTFVFEAHRVRESAILALLLLAIYYVLELGFAASLEPAA